MTLDKKTLDHARKSKKKVQVFTPVEAIDFINNSIDYILKTEFGKPDGINSPDVQITDPFAGEANFTCRGIDAGTISKETAARIDHMEILPESAEIAKQNLIDRGVKNPKVRNVDTFNEGTDQ